MTYWALLQKKYLKEEEEAVSVVVVVDTW